MRWKSTFATATTVRLISPDDFGQREPDFPIFSETLLLMKKLLVLGTAVCLTLAVSAQSTRGRNESIKAKVDTRVPVLMQQSNDLGTQIASLEKQKSVLTEQRNQLTAQREMIARKGDLNQADVNQVNALREKETGLVKKISDLDTRIADLKKQRKNVDAKKDQLLSQ